MFVPATSFHTTDILLSCVAYYCREISHILNNNFCLLVLMVRPYHIYAAAAAISFDLLTVAVNQSNKHKQIKCLLVFRIDSACIAISSFSV